MLGCICFDWRLATYAEGEAMSPAALHRLFDAYDRHQTWRRQLMKKRK